MKTIYQLDRQTSQLAASVGGLAVISALALIFGLTAYSEYRGLAEELRRQTEVEQACNQAVILHLQDQLRIRTERLIQIAEQQRTEGELLRKILNGDQPQEHHYMAHEAYYVDSHD